VTELIISVFILRILSIYDMDIVFMFDSIWAFKHMSINCVQSFALPQTQVTSLSLLPLLMKSRTKKYTKILYPNLWPRDLLLVLFPNMEMGPNAKGKDLLKISNFLENLLLFFRRLTTCKCESCCLLYKPGKSHKLVLWIKYYCISRHNWSWVGPN
jgi:hypothetical protein